MTGGGIKGEQVLKMHHGARVREHVCMFKTERKGAQLNFNNKHFLIYIDSL